MTTDIKDYRLLLREIQNSTTIVYSPLPSEEPRFLIDINSRMINVPPELGFLAIENDHNSQKVYFEIDRFFDGIDLAEHTCIIQFINIEKTKTSNNERSKPNVGKCPNKCLNVPAINVPPASEPKKTEGYFVVTEMDVESIEGKIIFEWRVENKATSLAGDIFFSVRFYSINDSGEFVYNFNTLPAHSLILDTIDVINGNSSMDASEIEILLAKLKNLQNEINEKVDVAQGSENSGKFLAINELGNVDVVTLPDISSSKEIYVGSGDMPDGYTLQIDPTGEADDMVDEYTRNLVQQLQNDVSNKLDKSGHPTNMYLGTDHNGNITYKLEPEVTSTADKELSLTSEYPVQNKVITAKINSMTQTIADNEIFETDILTVNALGGIVANADLNGMTTHEILTKLLYPYVAQVVAMPTRIPSSTVLEKGDDQTITAVSVKVTKKSEVIISVALYNGDTLLAEKTGGEVAAGGTFTFSDLSVAVPSTSVVLTVKVTDASGNVVSKSTAAWNFVYPYYTGVCAEDATIDEALVEGLTKKVEVKGNKAISFTSDNQRCVFAYPKSYGVLKSILDPNSFESLSSFTQHEVSITGLDGTAQTYYVYVNGASTVTDFIFTFKY